MEAAVDQQTHLQEKEGEAGDMHTFKKDKIVHLWLPDPGVPVVSLIPLVETLLM